MQAILEGSIFIVTVIILASFVGKYIYKIFANEKVWISGVVRPIEERIYRMMGIDANSEMTGKQYIAAILSFTVFGFLLLFGMMLIQSFLFLNPEGLGNVSFATAFNTAVSYVTNTNWQSYAGESTMSYLSQSMGLTVQNFLSVATGIAILFVVIRGFVQVEKKLLGNFWVDIVRITLYVLLPFSIIIALLLVSQGVVQSIQSYVEVSLLESGELTKYPLGMVASQVAIKQLGTNGGGFFGANSAFPLENPTFISNFIEMVSIILLPASLCFTFGEAIKDKKQGHLIFIVMLIFLVIGISVILMQEYAYIGAPEILAGAGNLEGKELRFGISSSSIWSGVATAVSSGAVNSMLDSYTPMAGFVMMFFMQLGEIIFGGAGSGLYGMIAFCLLTVFISGLMVGRTPEFFGKKVLPFDMKMMSVVLLMPTLLTLSATAIAVILPGIDTMLGNSGAHGFSEVLYNMTSSANNNGSAFAGFATSTLFMDMTTSILMILGRFVPMIAMILLAENFSTKKKVAQSKGTLITTNAMFATILTISIIVIGALSFMPALALGPIADFVQHFM